MPRKYFINPYTFVPLDTNPVLKRNDPAIDHLWIHDDKFTGRIDLELTFITPAVIPGKQKPGSSDESGKIETYIYEDCEGNKILAIPGSRLRGHIFNLMRTINSSPVTQYEDRTILHGTVKDKVDNANGGKAKSIQPCLVKQLAGWSNDELYGENKGMKSRLWFEMAMGPRKDDVEIECKNLRILSSQPPKAHNFYLEGGDYSTPGSKIRGRKFYWHDPFWKIKMWDNEDLDEGDCAFENPTPDVNKEQWSNAEVIMATMDKPVTFCLTVRAMNLTRDERNLLLTSLLGFAAEDLTSDKGTLVLGQRDTYRWCHKIGHARPFMGSAFIRVTGAREIGFDKDWKPFPEKIELNNWIQDLNNWQKNFKGNHIDALNRVMRFAGAYETDLDKGPDELRMTYPLGQRDVSELTWNNRDPEHQPKTYHWFTNNRDVDLPEPLPNESQALNIWVSRLGERGNPPRAVQRNRQGPVGSGAMAQAMRRAEDTKRRGKGRKK